MQLNLLKFKSAVGTHVEMDLSTADVDVIDLTIDDIDSTNEVESL